MTLKEIYVNLEKEDLRNVTNHFTGIVHVIVGLLGSGFYYGDIIYYKDGFIHREDGPAIVSLDGKYSRYILRDKMYSSKEYWIKIYKQYKNTNAAQHIMAQVLGSKNEI